MVKNKLWLLMLPILAILFIPKDVNARTMSSTYGTNYYRQYSNNSSYTSNHNSFSGNLPVYPFNGYIPSYAKLQNYQLQFVLDNPNGTDNAIGYNYVLTYRYTGAGIGVYNENLVVTVNPAQGDSYVQSQASVVDVDNYNVTVKGTVILNNTLTLSGFLITVNGNIADCGFSHNTSNSGHGGASLTFCGSSITTQLTSINFTLEASQDLNSTLLNNLNTLQEENNRRLEEVNNNLNEINDYMTDSTSPSSDISSLANVQGLLPAGPVDSLLNIPFKFLSVIVSSLGELCTPLSFDFIFNSQINIPCFQSVFYDNVPSDLMIFINLIPSAFILIKYFKHLYKKVDRATSLNSNADDEWGVL